METVFYKCEVCGFTHQVPSYWTGFAPEKQMEMDHIDLDTKEMCPSKFLLLIES